MDLDGLLEQGQGALIVAGGAELVALADQGLGLLGGGGGPGGVRRQLGGAGEPEQNDQGQAEEGNSHG